DTPPAVADRPPCVQAIAVITAPAVPRMAPSRPSAAAVATVIVRRVARWRHSRTGSLTYG
ncbi:MAG TPA: hypothetical protein VK802_12900, partial [Streptosporangiaceae bacterium]|nr:hypothetical protein [Streptosporangiaceae bacterium]